jgi:flagellar hook-basal body complex protein FliE
VTGIDSIGSMVAAAAGAGASKAPAANGAPFGGLLQGIMAETTKADAAAQTAVTGLLNGSGVEVHEAMIATQKSDMAFELALQVRNKAVGAYQQMMGMQF